jgi:predicted transposase YbfD/YdcC
MHSTTLPFAVPLPPGLPFAFSLQALAEHLHSVPDRRKPRGIRYPLPVLLSLAILAKLAGQTRLEPLAHWAQLRATDLATLFGLERPRMPHQSTWSRVLGEGVAPEDVEDALQTFFHVHAPTTPERASIVLAVDGKTLRGTIPLGQTRGVHLVAAYLPETGVVLAQLAVDKKENEIVVVPTLLAQLDLHGVVVTGDAMQAQRALSAQVVEAGGDYLWFVKENQPTLLGEIAELFTRPAITPGHAAPRRDFEAVRQLDKGHGRLEERLMTTSSMLAGYSDWPFLAQVFKLERTVWERGEQTLHEIRYGITSVPKEVAGARRVLQLARGEWGIENGLHYRRDVTLGEDACQLRRGGGPQVMAALNNTVISLFGQVGEDNLAAVQRRFAYHFERFLACLKNS